MTTQPVYLEHYVFDNDRREGVHTAYSDTFEVTDEQLTLMKLIVETRDQTVWYNAKLNFKRALNYMYDNYEKLAPFMVDVEDMTIEKDEMYKLSRYDVEYVLETAQIHVPCQFDHYDNVDGNINMYQPQGVVAIYKGNSPHEQTNSEKDDSFFTAFAEEMLTAFNEGYTAFAEEMLAALNEGYVDYQQNFDCPYDHKTPKQGAWAAGYAKAQQESQQ